MRESRSRKYRDPRGFKDCSTSRKSSDYFNQANTKRLYRTFLEGNWYMGTYPDYYSSSAVSGKNEEYYLQHRHGKKTYNAYISVDVGRFLIPRCEKCGDEPPEKALAMLKLAQWER